MAGLLYKDDWDACRDSLTGWWQRKVIGRPAVGVAAPRAKPLPFKAAYKPSDVRDQWLNVRSQIARHEETMTTHYHGGVCFPYMTACLGPGSLNLFLGCEAGFMPETIWYKPINGNPKGLNLELRPDNFYWKWTLDTTRAMLDHAKGKCPVGMPDIIEGLDILSEVLGTEELLTCLIDCPEEIHRLLRQLDDIYYKAFDPLFKMVKDDRGGNVFIAFYAWGPGKTLKTQCDFSTMISTDMFAEFVVPYLEKQCARCDFSAYHLDGPGAMRHLDLLCKVKSLKAIQWTPGHPNPAPADRMWWDKIWKKVYASGKSAMVLGNPPELVEPFLKEFGQAGTMITTGTDTEREARKLLDDCVKWGK